MIVQKRGRTKARSEVKGIPVVARKYLRIREQRFCAYDADDADDDKVAVIVKYIERIANLLLFFFFSAKLLVECG